MGPGVRVADNGKFDLDAGGIPRPGCPLDAATREKLLRLAAADPGGWLLKGGYVAVAEFGTAWSTAFARVLNVPSGLVGPVPEVAAYVRALHGSLLAAYAARDMPLPRWRSWQALVTRWPFLATPAAAVEPRRRVHVLRPLC